MSPLTRRSVTAGLGAAVAAIPAVGLAVGVSSELHGLMKAHRAGYRAFTKAIDHEQELKAAYKVTDVLVPCILGGESYELRLGRDFCEQHIAAAFHNARRAVERLGHAAPELVKQLQASLDAQAVDNMKLLDRLSTEEEARKEASGLAAAERNLHVTADAEEAAFLELCAYRCRSPEEARVKAEYLLTTSTVKDMWEDDAKALLKSFVDEQPT